MLVVLPAITWLGTDPVDDPPVLDGIPDLLTRTGAACAAARVRGRGRPPGGASKSDVAPLLMFLDRAGIRYDLTSDLDLTSPARRARATARASCSPAASAGSRPMARRLRRYVLDGGHVAVFGADTLRRGVTLRTRRRAQRELVRPTQPTPTDPFGARCRRSDRRDRRTGPSSPAPRVGLLAGSDGSSTASPPSRSPAAGPGGRARVLAALGRGEAGDEAPRRR